MPGRVDDSAAPTRTPGYGMSEVAATVREDRRRALEHAMRSVYAHDRLADAIRDVVEDALDPVGSDMHEHRWVSRASPPREMVEVVVGATLDDLIDRLAAEPEAGPYDASSAATTSISAAAVSTTSSLATLTVTSPPRRTRG